MGVGSVNRIHMGSVKLAGRYDPPTFVDTRIDVYGYLVITDASDVVLIDTGVGEGNAYVETTFAPNRMSIDDELARVGVAVPREQAHAGLTDRYLESIVRLKALGVPSPRFSHDLTG
ncbi:MAG TPA: hypothetical protein VIZ30_01615 [Pseudomonadales bacterium]